MRNAMCSLKYIIFFFLLAYSTWGQAEDLLCIYQLAEINDPLIQAAKASQLAAREALPQARAQFMPVISASSSHTSYDTLYTSNQAIDVPTQIFPSDLHYNQSVYALSLTQPIFYYQQWVQLAKACEQVKQANATFAAALQDLIARTVQGYFDVLKASDTLKFATANRVAFDKFTEHSEQRFKVGLIGITDVQVAKAQRDNAFAQEIAAKNELENKKEQLRTITGEKIDTYSFLRDNLYFRAPEPANIEQWVKEALEQNFSLLAARFQVEASRNDVKLNSANHLPTLSIGAGISRSTSIPTIPRNTNRNVGLQVQMPLFSGGSVLSKTRQAAYTYEQIYQQMEALQRQIASNTRQAYLGVLTQISQVSALQKAVVSNLSALKATEDAFDIGTRTMTDILTAQRDLIRAEQSYAFARYDYILQTIFLKQAAGTLNPDDVRHINAMLKD
jgi:outer membrane protein